MKLLTRVLLGWLMAVLLTGQPSPALAVTEVELEGTVVSVQATLLTIDADGARLTLDVAEIDPAFIAALLPGDQVRVAAFRLPDQSLLVYSMFVQSRATPSPPPPRPTPEPE